MTLSPPKLDARALEDRAEVEFALASKSDVPEAAEIFVNSFPKMIQKWFSEPDKSRSFCRDLFELLWRNDGNHFFVARRQGRLAGYLILILPERGFLRGLFRNGFLWRALAHAIAGKYGYSAKTLFRILQSVTGRGRTAMEQDLSGSPHIYNVAVATEFAGHGIGTGLLKRARAACEKDFDRMWLTVDQENDEAVRMYEKDGFRTVATQAGQYLMVRDLKSGLAGASLPL